MVALPRSPSVFLNCQKHEERKPRDNKSRRPKQNRDDKDAKPEIRRVRRRRTASEDNEAEQEHENVAGDETSEDACRHGSRGSRRKRLFNCKIAFQYRPELLERRGVQDMVLIGSEGLCPCDDLLISYVREDENRKSAPFGA